MVSTTQLPQQIILLTRRRQTTSLKDLIVTNIDSPHLTMIIGTNNSISNQSGFKARYITVPTYKAVATVPIAVIM